MSHCHDEHAGHGSHGDDHGHEHDHTDDITPALHHNLYQHINFDKIVTYNEAEAGSGRAIVEKPWTERLQPSPELVSHSDEQLLMTIPFTGQVKLHSILIRTSATASAPRTLKLFTNRDDLDFDSAEVRPPTQVLELSQTNELQEVPVRRALFNSVQSLTLFFADNFGSAYNNDGSDGSDDDDDDDDDEEEEHPTRISYLAFRGEWMALGRAPINILYEAAPNPSDHKIKGTKISRVSDELGGRHGGGY